MTIVAHAGWSSMIPLVAVIVAAVILLGTIVFAEAAAWKDRRWMRQHGRRPDGWRLP